MSGLSSPPKVRKGESTTGPGVAEFVRTVTRAFELTGEKSPVMMDTLAAAYIEAGDFDGVVRWEEKALADPQLIT